MQDEYRIGEEKAEDREQAGKEILRQLLAYNASQAGPLNHQQVVLTARGRDQAMVGGLVGAHYWNGMFIDLLWIHDAHRGQGIGSALMKRVEADTKARGGELLFLNTFSFQAPGFYEKLGYKAFGTLEGMPRNASRTWYCKRI
jgi:GNAT superfamily N-acetyltransferase